MRDIGGGLRERVPADRLGKVTEAPFGGPMKVTFQEESWWHGRREITVTVYPGEVATVR